MCNNKHTNLAIHLLFAAQYLTPYTHTKQGKTRQSSQNIIKTYPIHNPLFPTGTKLVVSIDGENWREKNFSSTTIWDWQKTVLNSSSHPGEEWNKKNIPNSIPYFKFYSGLVINNELVINNITPFFPITWKNNTVDEEHTSFPFSKQQSNYNQQKRTKPAQQKIQQQRLMHKCIVPTLLIWLSFLLHNISPHLQHESTPHTAANTCSLLTPNIYAIHTSSTAKIKSSLENLPMQKKLHICPCFVNRLF